jgi:hypothetical protein
MEAALKMKTAFQRNMEGSLRINYFTNLKPD